MLSYSIIFLTILTTIQAISLPCSRECSTCSSSSQCTTCASQYYPTSLTGVLKCLPCGSYCLACSSPSNCTLCMNPYVLQTDGSCQPCVISNAIQCTSTISASQCNTGYYVSDNYCYNCLLNCKECSSRSDCKSCI